MAVYRTEVEGIEPAQLEGFFVDWPRRPSPERHLELLRRSDEVVVALDGERVVGFVSALTDGVLSAYIPLLEVLPEYQGRGIGSELVRRLLAELGPLYMIDLLCDEQLVPFYERLGLRPIGVGVGVRSRDALG